MVEFLIPTPAGEQPFSVEMGTSLYFVGANGGGKTRLAVHIETKLGEQCHRIAAHRALALNPSVAKVSEKAARSGLRFGTHGENAQVGHRVSNRWRNKAAVQLLNDYDFLIQALFAEQSNTSLNTHNAVRAGDHSIPTPTKFEKLNEIWKRLLPHRKLNITGDDIQVSASDAEIAYGGGEMSDGERAIFYLIGQTLIAEPGILLIFDEPELHIHRAILSRLWDEIESARPDCGMVSISHDLDFVASRKGQKFVLRSYAPGPIWTVAIVPEDSGFSEEITTLILGSRQPILFIEGKKDSLDRAIYRACYPQWTIIPRGSCENVLGSVMTMRANAMLTRILCAGIVDSDDYNEEEIARLAAHGVSVLPVSEIENIILMPDVIRAIAKTEGFTDEGLDNICDQIAEEVYAHASGDENRNNSLLRYCRRRIDRSLKVVDLKSSKTLNELMLDFRTNIELLNIENIANSFNTNVKDAVLSKDIGLLLRWYDNKGLLNIASKAKGTTKKYFEQWLIRSMGNGAAPEVVAAIKGHLPTLVAS